MIKRITVQDYMAHKETSLELAEGVTVITGPNNAGKSALVEAIRSVAQNPPIRHAIRHGAARAVVQVELDTGEIIQWIRSEKNAVYRLTRSPGQEPETYAKFGRTVPQDIAALLRMDPVETESGSVDIHIGNQRYPIFLLDQAGSQAAGFFAASTEAEYLLRMQQLLKKRVDRARTVRRELLDKNESIGKELGSYAPMDLLGEQLERAEEMQREISRQEKLFPPMEEMLRSLSRVLHELGYTLSSLDVLEQAQSPPGTLDVLFLVGLLEDMAALQREVTFHGERADRLSLLQAPHVIGEVRTLEMSIQNQASCELRLQAMERQDAAVSSLQGVPGLQPIFELDQLLRTTLNQNFALAHAVNRDRVFQALQFPPVLPETTELLGLVRMAQEREADWYFVNARSNVLDELKEAGAPGDTTTLEAMVSALANLQEACLRALERDGLFTALGAPPVPSDQEDLAATVSLMAKQIAMLDATDARLRLLARLQDTGSMKDVASLEAIIQDMAGLLNILSENAMAEDEIARALGAGRAELQRVVDEMKSCPLCGQLLDVEHLLRTGHD